VRPEAGRLRAGVNSACYRTATSHHQHKERPRLWLTLALLGIITALGVGAWWRVSRSTLPIGIAIWPFENLNHEPTDAYLADDLRMS